MSGRDNIQPADPALQIARLYEELRSQRAYIDGQFLTDRARLTSAESTLSALGVTVTAIGASIPWVPLLDQGGTVTATVNRAVYSLVGNWCFGEFQLTSTGVGPGAGQAIRVSRPVTGATFAAEIMVLGAAYTLDAAGGVGQIGTEICVLGNEQTWFRFIRTDAPIGNYYGTDPSFTLAAGDKLAGFFAYRTA